VPATLHGQTADLTSENSNRKALSAVLNGLLNSLIEDDSLNKNGRKLETYKFMVL
jgi:hypothetical protein